MKEKRETNFNEIMRIFLCIIISTIFLCVFSAKTSPLVPGYYGTDSAFFMLVGQGMTKGLLPYRDFFDMKGPYLFFIEYIGQLLCYGRTGCFIIQIIGMSVSMYFWDKTYRLIMKKSNLVFEFLMIIPLLLNLIASMNGGNLTEEISLPFLSVCLYFILSFFYNCEKKETVVNHNKWYTLFYGFSFGVILLIRITNAALIGAILLTMTAFLIKEKKYAELFKNAGVFLGGTIIAIIPMFAYCYFNGILKEMLYQVFEFGFVYSSETSLFDSLKLMTEYEWLGFIPLIGSILILLLFKEKDIKYWIFSISNALLVCLAVLMGNAYYHYFTLAVPNILFLIWIVYKNSPKLVNIKTKCLMVVLSICFILSPAYKIYQEFGYNFWAIVDYHIAGDNDNTKKIMSFIPAEDRDSVYCYFDFASRWYCKAGIFPCIKYCDWQDHYIKLCPEIEEDLTKIFIDNPPKWLVLQSSSEKPYVSFIENAINFQYIKIAEEDGFLLYMLK